MKYQLALDNLQQKPNIICNCWTWPSTNNTTALCKHQRMRRLWLTIPRPELLLDGTTTTWQAPVHHIGWVKITNRGGKDRYKYVPDGKYEEKYREIAKVTFDTEDGLYAYLKLVIDEQ